VIDAGLEREVHVWSTKISALAVEEPRFFGMLDARERERALRFRFAWDRSAYVISHGVLRELLARYVGRAPEALEFGVGEWGKPYLLEASGCCSTVAFNLSHSADFALIALARNRAVGVDVERWNVESNFDEIAETCFSGAERAQLRSLAPKRRDAGFHAGWTRKEAYIKALGVGISAGLDYFDVALGPGPSTLLIDDRRRKANVFRWRLIDVPMVTGYSAALCAEGSDWFPRHYPLAVRG
jgi:4'-phosphopantetheinyl transferase